MTKTIFKDKNALIDILKANTQRFPITTRYYSSIIEAFHKNNKNTDPHDWLMHPTIEKLCTWSDMDDPTQYIKWLEEVEEDIKVIHSALGDTEFDILIEEVSKKCGRLKTAYAVYNKTLETIFAASAFKDYTTLTIFNIHPIQAF